MTLSDDPISPSTQESSNSSYVRSKEAEKNSPSQETDEEVLKGYESYRENPSNYDNDNILIYTDTFNLYDDMFEGTFFHHKLCIRHCAGIKKTILIPLLLGCCRFS